MHESSTKRTNNVVDLSYLGTANIATQLNTGQEIAIARHTKRVVKNRNTLSKLIDNTKFCEMFKLPSRGHDESICSTNPGMVCGLVDLVSQFDSALKSHLEPNSLFKRISKAVQNENLNSMFEVCREEIQNEIKYSEFLAVMIDETTDISEKSKLVITFRYVKKDKPVERFVFFNPVDLTEETLASLVEAELTPLRL